MTFACHAQVSWFDVRQLTATAVKTLTSTIVGSMSGRRELMAALEADDDDHLELAGRDDVWIDYIADCGDGWNASHSVAWLIGRDHLSLSTDRSPAPQPPSPDCRAEAVVPEQPGRVVLPAGKVLILGGDQVYPTASAAAYQERLVGPMRSARFFEEGGRKVFAIPGNHDWYDGLTSFVRLFCQAPRSRRWLGAWQTVQRRSYFALPLPHGWWIWGLDLALEDDLDPPQYDYFLDQAEKLQPGDRLILAVPTPVWLKQPRKMEGEAKDEDEQTTDKLELIMTAALRREGVSIPLVVTGDSHFYSHHRAEGIRNYIVCGGGGAFTTGTTQVPDEISLREGQKAPVTALFPDRSASSALRWGVLKFPFVNVAFSGALVAMHLINLWLLNATLEQGIVAAATDPDIGHMIADLLSTVVLQPALAIWVLVVVAGFAAFARGGARSDQPAWLPTLVGVLHALAHIGGVLALAWICLSVAPIREQVWWITVPVLAFVYLYGGLLFGAYLALTHWALGMHNMEVYSAQAIEDWKSFLRIKVADEGLTVYAVGLRTAAKSWVAAPKVEEVARRIGGPLVRRRTFKVPAGCRRVLDPRVPLEPHLIEPPFICGAREPDNSGRQAPGVRPIA